jgi:glycosyltransferase involved in cell wall biosynthesis
MTARANPRNIKHFMQRKSKGDKLNILTFATHERYEENLCKTGHNFYSLTVGKQWDETYAPVPENYFIIEELPTWVDFDLVLSHTSCQRLQIAHDLLSGTTGQEKKLPMPILRHCHVLPDIRNDVTSQVFNYKNVPVDYNSFISAFNQKQWGFQPENSFVIEHGIDTDFWKPSAERLPEIKACLSVVNEFPSRDWCCGFNLWQAVTSDLPQLVVGKSTGKHKDFSKPAKDKKELRDFYRRSRLFLNTSLHSPVPTVMLEAMSCGCPIVSTENCMIPDIIEHGVNGFMSNKPEELKYYCELLLTNKSLAQKLGENARKTIEQKFNLNRFVKDWNNILYKVVGDFKC